MSNSWGIYVVKIGILLSLGIILLVSAPSDVQACSCVEPGSTEGELSRSTAVFTGKVLEVEKKKRTKGFTTRSVLFEVSEAWKGVTESQIIVGTGQGGGDCGFEFEVGQEYIVYANSSSMYGSDDELVAIVCSRTNELTEATSDLAILGPGETTFKTVRQPNRVAELHIDGQLVADRDLEVNSGESSGISLYVWMIVAVALGIVGFLIWRRAKNSSR